jgi:hypothetical protein
MNTEERCGRLCRCASTWGPASLPWELPMSVVTTVISQGGSGRQLEEMHCAGGGMGWVAAMWFPPLRILRDKATSGV